MPRGTRGSGAKNRGKNNLSSRQELIKKHGLSSFREDPVENRKLQETSSVNFTEQYGAVKHKDRFLGDPKSTGGADAKKSQTRNSNITFRLGYPLSRGSSEKTGDTFLIKCLEYMPPTSGMGAGLSLTPVEQEVKDGGSFTTMWGQKKQVKTGQKVVTGYKDLRMDSTDANSRMSRNSKIKYYVELPVPQEINDSNVVTWGDDTMNIFQLAGVSAASQFMDKPGESFQKGLDVIQKGIDLGSGLPAPTQNAIRNAIAGAAINQIGGNVNASSIIARSTGQVLNSNLELLFGGVNLRTFPFSVTFTPRYYEEMLVVKKIIRQFKMAMSAKAGTMSGGSASGIFLKSPDVFSLRYLHNGQDHPFLNRFKMCALTGMNVNYTNAGAYASYEDGSPVSIRMNLTFKELNPIYSEDYDGMSDEDGVGF
tara:strand:- start:744 stop:2012 length:1269 start_codon:yes stop_codon:yes gene_type:complete